MNDTAEMSLQMLSPDDEVTLLSESLSYSPQQLAYGPISNPFS